jgi:predicted RNase H-like HicB family nuclease
LRCACNGVFSLDSMRSSGTRKKYRPLLCYTPLEASATLSARCLPKVSRRRMVNLEATHMKLKVVIHEADEGGFWAEVPAIAGCATQGETLDELMANLHEAIEGCLSVDLETVAVGASDKVVEVNV